MDKTMKEDVERLKKLYLEELNKACEKGLIDKRCRQELEEELYPEKSIVQEMYAFVAKSRK